jgi:uncharacterized membrane protein YtjA (UPF0391 family)
MELWPVLAINGAKFRNVRQEPSMLKWAAVFLLIAIVAGIFGFTGVEEASASIAKILFGIFMVLFLGAVVIGLAIGAKLTS